MLIIKLIKKIVEAMQSGRDNLTLNFPYLPMSTFLANKLVVFTLIDKFKALRVFFTTFHTFIFGFYQRKCQKKCGKTHRKKTITNHPHFGLLRSAD